MPDMTPAKARRALSELIDKYGGDAVFAVYAGRASANQAPMRPDDVVQLQEIDEVLEAEEITRKTGGNVEETPEGMAAIQEAGLRESDTMTEREARDQLRGIVADFGALKTFDTLAGRLDRTVARDVPDDGELSVIIEVIGEDAFEALTRGTIDATRRVTVDTDDDGTATYIFDDTGVPKTEYSDAVARIRDVLGPAERYEDGEDAGVVAFKSTGGNLVFDSYVAAQPAPAQPSDNTASGFGSLKPERVDPDPDDPTTATQQTFDPADGTGDTEFPTEPDAATREAMRSDDTRQQGLGGAPTHEEAARATEEAAERQQRREQRAQSDRERDQQTISEIGDVDSPDLSEFDSEGGDTGNW